MKANANCYIKLLVVIMMAIGYSAQAQPQADFTSDVTTGCSLPLEVNFTDLSTVFSTDTIRQRIWNFGNGVTIYTNDKNPTVTYTMPGVYTVMLIAVESGTSLRDTMIKTAYIDVSGSLHIDTTFVNTTCYNCSDGSITLNVTGGLPPYTYQWGNGVTQPINSGLAYGPQTVTVTDAAGCINSQTYLVDSLCNHFINSIVTPVGCSPGNPTGAITFTTLPGSTGLPWTYAWSNGETTRSISNLAQGNYTLTITDATSCSESYHFTVDSSAPIEVYANVTPYPNGPCPIICYGMVEIVPTVGIGPYNYTWSPFVFCDFGPCNASAASLDTISVSTSDSRGCMVTTSYDVTMPCSFTSTITTTPVSCQGINDGTASVVTTGGTPPYRYTWRTWPYQTGVTSISNVKPGTYNLEVIDATGCTTYEVFTIGQPTPLSWTLNVTDATCPTCPDGNVTVVATGGVPPYAYAINGGSYSASNFIPGLQPGSYVISVRDMGGCIGTDTVIIANACAGLVSLSLTVTDATCVGCSDGSITATANGGTPPYLFSIDSGPFQVGIVFGNLPTGNYTIEVEDANGCTVQDFATILELCSGLVTTTTATDVSCFGSADGMASVTVSGGITPIYIWSNGATTPSIGGCVPGVYYVTVEDGNGCTVVDSVTIQQPPALQVTTTGTDASCLTACADGTATATVTGGTPPYTYVWNTTPVQTSQTAVALTSGFYTVTVADHNGCTATGAYTVGPICNLTVNLGNDTAVCFGTYTIVPTISNGTLPYTYNWSIPLITDSTLTVSSPDVYILTVTDNNGCDAVGWVTITDANTNAVATGDTTICIGGTALLTASGGNSYVWSPSASLSNPNSANPLASPITSTTYTVEIDNGVCASTRAVTVTVDTDCIWPGDADNSGIADNNDVLAIGIGFGNTGPLRNSASIVWEGQLGSNWTNNLANGTNYKHVDTDGNGNINADDTLAITLNYGLTHPKTEERSSVANPDLYIAMPDTVLAGETVFATIHLGSDTAPIQNVYGIKFSVTYDNMLVDTNTVHLNLDTCWLGTFGVDLLGFTKDLYSLGRVDLAITRTNHTSVTGGGPIGLLSFTMKDDVSGKDLLAIPMELEILAERAIDELEQELSLTKGSKTIVVVQDTSTIGINEAMDNAIQVYPNPTQGLLNINSQQPIRQVRLTNLLGQSLLVLSPETNNKAQVLDVSGLTKGMYILQITTTMGNSSKPIILE